MRTAGQGPGGFEKRDDRGRSTAVGTVVFL